MSIHLQFSRFLLSDGLGRHFDPGSIGAEFVGSDLKTVSRVLDFVAQPHQVGPLVVEPQAAGISGRRLPCLRGVEGDQAVEDIVESMPDSVDISSNLLAFRGLLAQIGRQGE